MRIEVGGDYLYKGKTYIQLDAVQKAFNHITSLYT